MDDLVRATGLGKQSLYNAFEGKRELYLRALTSDVADAVAAVDEALGSDEGIPLERIRAHLLKLAITFSAGNSKTALLIKATVELADRDNDVAKSALQAFEDSRGIYRNCLADAQACGEIGDDADLDGLASFFLALTRGMEDIGKAGIARTELTNIAMTALDSIVAANEPQKTSTRLQGLKCVDGSLGEPAFVVRQGAFPTRKHVTRAGLPRTLPHRSGSGRRSRLRRRGLPRICLTPDL